MILPPDLAAQIAEEMQLTALETSEFQVLRVHWLAIVSMSGLLEHSDNDPLMDKELGNEISVQEQRYQKFLEEVSPNVVVAMVVYFRCNLAAADNQPATGLLDQPGWVQQAWNPNECTVERTTDGKFTVIDHSIQTGLFTADSAAECYFWLIMNRLAKQPA